MTPFYKRPDTNGAKIMNNEMARIYCLIPPIQEQTKITQYLDHQTAIIDQLIKQKEKLHHTYDVLKEKKKKEKIRERKRERERNKMREKKREREKNKMRQQK